VLEPAPDPDPCYRRPAFVDQRLLLRLRVGHGTLRFRNHAIYSRSAADGNLRSNRGGLAQGRRTILPATSSSAARLQDRTHRATARRQHKGPELRASAGAPNMGGRPAVAPPPRQVPKPGLPPAGSGSGGESPAAGRKLCWCRWCRPISPKWAPPSFVERAGDAVRSSRKPRPGFALPPG